MKKTAVMLYDTCCLFELTVALQMLRMAEKPVEYFAKNLTPIRTEERMLVVADNTFEYLDVKEYDSLLITGASDARMMVEDRVSQEFVRKFHNAGALIGAISIAPILLLKLGYLKGKPFMIGVEKHHLYEEGFSDEDLRYMVGWEESCKGAVQDKYLQTDNIITSVAFGFRQWAMAFGRGLNIDVWPKSFDL